LDATVEKLQWLEEQAREYEKSALDCAARARRFWEEARKLRGTIQPSQTSAITVFKPSPIIEVKQNVV
jgi:hypothetical protein